MKKPMWIIAFLSIFLNISLLYFFVIKGAVTTSNDKRIAIEISEQHEDFVMEEMRDFLESVQQISEGILKNDPSKIIKAGQKSGGSVIAHAPKGLLAKLPVGFKKMGFSVHDAFDEIAKTATEEPFDPQASHRQLDKMLNTCVACHSLYKFELEKIIK